MQQFDIKFESRNVESEEKKRKLNASLQSRNAFGNHTSFLLLCQTKIIRCLIYIRVVQDSAAVSISFSNNKCKLDFLVLQI